MIFLKNGFEINFKVYVGIILIYFKGVIFMRLICLGGWGEELVCEVFEIEGWGFRWLVIKKFWYRRFVILDLGVGRGEVKIEFYVLVVSLFFWIDEV